MSSPDRRRWTAAAGLVASLAALPALLMAAAGPPAVAGLPSWGWLTQGLRDQYLPVEPLLAALGVLAWGLWAYAVLVTILRLVAVVAVRRRVGGSARLLAFSNLVTVAPLRSLVDAAVGVSLLASASHAVAAPAALADPPAVVRILDAPTGWARAQTLLGAVQADSALAEPGAVAGTQEQALAGGSAAAVDPDCPPDASDGRVYTVGEGDSLWRIAERELGDGQRWREIFAANQGRRMGDGQRLRDGGLILPGWHLLLPAPPGAPPSPAADPAPADPGPPTRPEPATPAPPAAAAPSTAAPDRPEPPSLAPAPDDGDHATRRDIVELPSGSMVGLSLAVGIAAALAVAGLRRRRRRRPLWPPAPSAQRSADRPVSATARLLAFAAARAGHPADADAVGPRDPAPRPLVPAARDPRDPTPARVAIGERNGQEAMVDVAGHGAVGILGPGADGLARAVLVGLLATGGPAAVEVLLVGTRLIPDAIGFPGLRRAAGLAGALHAVEAELVHRARLLEAEDAPDFASHRREHPDDPLPALILVADGISLEQAGRLAAILAQGPRLGVGALVAGSSVEAGAQLLLDDSGRVQTATPWTLSDQELVGVRACSLTKAEAAELLQVLDQSRSDDPEPIESEHPDATPTALPAPSLGPEEDGRLEDPDAPAAENPSVEALVQVRLLGPFTIQTAAGELRSGLRASARELLAYYLVHPEGASLEQAVEAMWPDTEPGRERERFWTALGNLRSVLRKVTGTAELKAIQRDGIRYRVDPGVFAVDLWRFQAAVATARRAELDPAVAAALAEAGDAYGGPLLDGVPYGWVEGPREDLRRRAVDALARLGELRQAARDVQGALVALEQAITVDPVAEELYRRLMRLQPWPAGCGPADLSAIGPPSG
jgi:DNA-binding SARP family transcriptional activator